MTYWRTEVVIYSQFDPQKVELSDLAREADQGDAICTRCEQVPVHESLMPEAALIFFKDES